MTRRRQLLLVGVAILSFAGSANGASPKLHRVSPRGGGYSVALPPGWRFYNASYPSDHATHVWWTRANPLARMVIVLSGCIGCVSTSTGAPNPAGAVSDADSTYRISATKLAFAGPYSQAEAGYDDNGIVLVTKYKGRVSGYVRVDLWLAPSQHSLATRILNSFRLG